MRLQNTARRSILANSIWRKLSALLILWHLGPIPAVAADAGTATPPFRLLISEVQPGSLAEEQRCTLIFPDHRFHHEVAARKRGRDITRKVYEGMLSTAEWDTVSEALERKDFRDLSVPATVAPLVMQDLHMYTIIVARDGNYQNMEFLNDKSRKAYDFQLRPLLQWWKAFCAFRRQASEASPNSRCLLNENNGMIFAQ